MKRMASVCWSHKAMYLGLAAAYGAVCLGWMDKETVNAVACGCYTALVTQKH
ncbi:MAG: hypothetical protein AAF672_16780 [Pseudomonadota bacterium]